MRSSASYCGCSSSSPAFTRHWPVSRSHWRSLPKAAAGGSPLARIEHELAPWVAFGILPLFGFANAGLSFADLSLLSVLKPVPLGIAAGLFFGKQNDVFGSA